MKWMNKLERKFGKYAIPNLMYYIIILYALGFVLNMIAPGFYHNYLSLNMHAVMQGQVWRLITFIVQPPNTNLLFVAEISGDYRCCPYGVDGYLKCREPKVLYISREDYTNMKNILVGEILYETEKYLMLGEYL